MYWYGYVGVEPTVLQRKFRAREKDRRSESVGGTSYIYNTTMAQENDREASGREEYEGNKVEYGMSECMKKGE